MTNVDQFESVFKSAAKQMFEYQKVRFGKVLIVTDLLPDALPGIEQQVKTFLGVIDREPGVEWVTLGGDSFKDVHALLNCVQEVGADLIVTWRHLHSTAWQWPHSLGEYLDVLAQVTDVPVLVLPHPDASHALSHTLEDTNRVMVITSHLTGDDVLVNTGLALTNEGGTLWLSHIEDGMQFDRMLEVVEKIPSIDTDTLREDMMKQLMKEPRDYIRSCQSAIESSGVKVKIEAEVTVGHRLSEYKRLIESHEVDLLLMHTKDEDQLAMHGLAYPLAVELREIPLLML